MVKLLWWKRSNILLIHSRRWMFTVIHRNVRDIKNINHINLLITDKRKKIMLKFHLILYSLSRDIFYINVTYQLSALILYHQISCQILYIEIHKRHKNFLLERIVFDNKKAPFDKEPLNVR